MKTFQKNSINNLLLFGSKVGEWRTKPCRAILASGKGCHRWIKSLTFVKKNVEVLLKGFLSHCLAVIRSYSSKLCTLSIYLSTMRDLNIKGMSKSDIEP